VEWRERELEAGGRNLAARPRLVAAKTLAWSPGDEVKALDDPTHLAITNRYRR
jgi:hypothetical protein